VTSLAAKAIREHAFAIVRSVSDLSAKTPTASGASWPAFKRTFDVVLAATLLLAALPVLSLIAVAIKLDSRGPVLYRVRRVGHRGRPLMMLKFRKMYDQASGIPLTADDDPRLTRVGSWLTRTRLDELPQLWDVLRGRMSVIGPRPEDPRFVALHAEHYEHILRVRPGMTGVSQLAFAKESVILDDDDPITHYVDRILPQKVSLDLLYAQRSRLGLDLAVFYWTLITVLLRLPVAVHRSTARMNLRRRRVSGLAPVQLGHDAVRQPVLELAPEPVLQPVLEPVLQHAAEPVLERAIVG
jgi:lipopolysaccharide/colanic/teichoic acid biosynthesis glycosyltransferase